MIYRNFKGMDISAIAFGAMRLPTLGRESEIDEEKTQQLVDRAIESGINYFDTAWGYHGGNSETALGKALKKHPRDSYYLATKFPSYDVSYFTKVEEIFEKQLEKCQVEYFDFYLLHNVNEGNIDYYLDDCTYGTVSYFLEQVYKGRIKHLGFSAHGSKEVIEKLLQKYGKYMEFGMIQLNYLDYDFQNARGKVELLDRYNIPVWVMEPLRGGMLANMDEENLAKMQALRPGITPVEIAFRFLQSLPSVTTVLSGMSDMTQMEEKIRIFQTDAPLSGLEMQTLSEVADNILSRKTVPCTSCRYCLSYCPKELDIPHLISIYNEMKVTDGGFLGPMAIGNLPKDKRPSSCIGCRACEKVCPQGIGISESLADLVKMADPFLKSFSGGKESA